MRPRAAPGLTPDDDVDAIDQTADTRRIDEPYPPPDSGSGPRGSSGAHSRIALGQGQIDNYRILDELGTGGMAVVYRAQDTRLRREVALKILHDHIAGRSENRERFEREARAVARLKHPNIMSVYGFSSPTAPVGYIAAELIRGETLREFVDRRGFAFPEVAGMVCLELAEALRHAHEQGVIHRDFKPENVMIARGGVPKLMDFGLARLLDAQTLTMTGAVLGSPAHMSPEAIEGNPVDERVDVFAFGTVLYFAATRRLPYDGRNPAVILNAILNGRYPDPQMVNARIGRRLAAIIERCMETDPAARYSQVDELVGDLRAWLAELGLTDIDGELAAFFAHPDAYEAELEQKLIERLSRLAEEAMLQGRVAAAIGHCDRILAIDEENAVAGRVIGRVQTRRRWQFVTALVLGIVATAACVWAWMVFILPGVGPGGEPPVVPAAEFEARESGILAAHAVVGGTRQTAALSAGLAEGEATSAVADAVQVARIAAAATDEASGVHARAAFVAYGLARSASQLHIRPRVPAAVQDDAVAEGSGEPEGSGEAATPPDSADEPALFPVRIRVQPLTAMIRIDGNEIGSGRQVEQQTLRLTAGQHRIEMNVPRLQSGRLSETFVVVPDAPNEFAFRVPWPPAWIAVRSSVPGTVTFDGRNYSTEDLIEVPITGNEAERWVDLEFFPPTGLPERRRVRVRTEQTVPVTFE